MNRQLQNKMMREIKIIKAKLNKINNTPRERPIYIKEFLPIIPDTCAECNSDDFKIRISKEIHTLPSGISDKYLYGFITCNKCGSSLAFSTSLNKGENQARKELKIAMINDWNEQQREKKDGVRND